MNYFDKIRSLNNLQLCHFLNGIGGELELVALALDKASNPDIYRIFSKNTPTSISGGMNC